MTGQGLKKHYRDIAFGENRARLRLLGEFHDLVIQYFDNSTLNMMSGNYVEKEEARGARAAIDRIMNEVYEIIRLADINPSAASTPAISVGGKGQNIDLIRNIFNLGRNEISPHAAVEYIERAVDVYKSNRLYSFIRTLNPFFWLRVLFNYITGGSRK